MKALQLAIGVMAERAGLGYDAEQGASTQPLLRR